MQTQIARCFTLASIDEAANWLLDQAEGATIIAFYGSMGAGKTTLIKSLVQAIGSPDPVSSPTYAIVNEYHYNDELGSLKKIYHLDLYRLKNLDEAIDIGIEEYLSSDAICLIEWPDKIKPLLPLETFAVNVDIIDNNQRNLTIFKK